MNLTDPYDGFSKVFDKIVSASKYEKWEKWIKNVWGKNNFFPESLLDFACGTGINSIRFSKNNIKCFGVDNSLSMLNEARKKNSSVTFLKGHFLNFKIPQNVDATICLDFSTNYILNSNEFVQFLNNVYGSLNFNGIFIFDFKPAKAFLKKEKHLQNDDFTFDWVCNVESYPFVVINIDILLKSNNQKFSEKHIERGYTIEEIKEIIKQTKFQLIEIYDNCVSKEPNEESELIQIVLKKI